MVEWFTRGREFVGLWGCVIDEAEPIHSDSHSKSGPRACREALSEFILILLYMSY